MITYPATYRDIQEAIDKTAEFALRSTDWTRLYEVNLEHLKVLYKIQETAFAMTNKPGGTI